MGNTVSTYTSTSKQTMTEIKEEKQNSLDKYMSFLYKKEEKECDICLEPFNFQKKDIVALPCMHIFHKNCVKLLINNNYDNCPECQTEFQSHIILNYI